MKDQIANLTPSQARSLLLSAMQLAERSIYAEKHADRIQTASRFGFLSAQIETLSEKNVQAKAKDADNQ